MRAALALCAAALAVRAARGSVADAALELLRSGEAAALHPELAWCGGQVGLPGGAREKGGPPYAAVHVALRPSSFPDVELLNLTLGVRGWRAAAGHVAVVTARSDAEYTLHSGTPREVGPGEITLALTNAPPVRAGRTLLTVRLIGGASVATVPQSAGASGLGSVDDGGMGIVLAACESEKGALAPCRPARLLVRYDAECAKPPKDFVMHDSLRVSRLTLGHFRIVANRLPSELRGAYALLPDDDLITEGAHYQSWLTVANLAGELRFDYLVRSEQPRALLGEEALRALARTLAVSNVARVSADRARSHAAASVGAVGVLVVALALAARVGARPAARRAFKRGQAHIPSASGAYTKVLSL